MFCMRVYLSSSFATKWHNSKIKSFMEVLCSQNMQIRSSLVLTLLYGTWYTGMCYLHRSPPNTTILCSFCRTHFCNWIVCSLIYGEQNFSCTRFAYTDFKDCLPYLPYSCADWCLFLFNFFSFCASLNQVNPSIFTRKLIKISECSINRSSIKKNSLLMLNNSIHTSHTFKKSSVASHCT